MVHHTTHPMPDRVVKITVREWRERKEEAEPQPDPSRTRLEEQLHVQPVGTCRRSHGRHSKGARGSRRYKGCVLAPVPNRLASSGQSADAPDTPNAHLSSPSRSGAPPRAPNPVTLAWKDRRRAPRSGCVARGWALAAQSGQCNAAAARTRTNPKTTPVRMKRTGDNLTRHVDRRGEPNVGLAQIATLRIVDGIDVQDSGTCIEKYQALRYLAAWSSGTNYARTKHHPCKAKAKVTYRELKYRREKEMRRVLDGVPHSPGRAPPQRQAHRQKRLGARSRRRSLAMAAAAPGFDMQRSPLADLPYAEIPSARLVRAMGKVLGAAERDRTEAIAVFRGKAMFVNHFSQLVLWSYVDLETQPAQDHRMRWRGTASSNADACVGCQQHNLSLGRSAPACCMPGWAACAAAATVYDDDEDSDNSDEDGGDGDDDGGDGDNGDNGDKPLYRTGP
ncbi:hypothetical protein HETIRDRAFT_118917 [Heterobasidion irregulare TC 32-1]|uniref:Uncharacterized protein n=1 Tax=Heterobasidion irregulare (strain TC 32-1) TaxID=747525 RepID=W4JTD0_HETIT|nr:uncharacterized protein HETIRDRAFT_118917 [Heterobasidion irregulare TC 32-1]ETW76724.1 hypothetical protein HETIRDRAFT_118917 [Heterobasidion irregulare TC 32-1]